MQQKVILGDSKLELQKIPAESVDLILTDPPYEIEDMSAFFSEFVRVLKKTGSVYIFGDTYQVCQNWFKQLHLPKKDLLIWHYKNSPKPKGRWRVSMQAIIYGYFSDAGTFNEDQVRIEYSESAKKLNGRMRPSLGRMKNPMPYNTSKGALPRDVIEHPALCGHLAKERVGHRDQKPLKLIEKLLLASSNEGDLILDPFAGSGTTLVASRLHNRAYIGIEIDIRNYKMIQSRLRSNSEVKP